MKTKLYDRIFKPKTIVLANGHSAVKKASRAPVIFIVLLALTIISFKVTGFNFAILFKRADKMTDILNAIIHPNLKYAKYVWVPLFNTVQMSIMGSFIGCILALPFSMLCSSNIVAAKPVLLFCRLVLSIIRTLPTLVTALIATMIFGLGTFAGTVAIALFNFSMVGKMMYEHIETVDMGAYEAMEALGATRTRSFITATMPQILPNYLSTCLYSVETTVRNATVLGYVGAGGIGIILNERISLRDYNSVGTILIMLFVTVFIIENISRLCRKKLS